MILQINSAGSSIIADIRTKHGPPFGGGKITLV